MSGASARKGSLIVNRTTHQTGLVVGASQFGRVLVKVTSGAVLPMERMNIQVISQ